MHTEPQDTVSYFRSLIQSGDSSEEFDQTLADFFPAIIYIYDTEEKKFSIVNKKLTDILGYSLEETEEWNNDFMKFVFKEDESLVRTELEKFTTLKDRETHSFNSRFVHKEGNWKYFRTQGKVLRRNESGTPAAILFIAQDITHELQTEEECKASVDLLNETEKLLHFGTWTWDILSEKVEWSKGLFNLLGYQENDSHQQSNIDTFIQHVSEPDREAVKIAIKDSLSQKVGFEKTFTITTNDKKEKIVSTRVKIILSPSGTVVKLIGVTNDITEQMLLNRREEELKANLSKYIDAIFEKERMLDFGSLEMDLVNNELYWSDGMYLLFGYETATDKGKFRFDENFYKRHMTESDLNTARKQLKEALATKNNYVIETSIKTRDGIAKRLETYGKIERRENGDPYKIVGITRDITRLNDYEKNLQQKIEELDRSNKELEEFAYIASHDLQEPLRKITAFSERLQEKAAGEIGTDGLLYLERILAATQNMRLLIDNLLEFSRTSRPNDSRELIDLNDVLREVLTDLELKIEETNAVIKYSPLPRITAYHSQMKQLFTNLLSNAIQFRKPTEAPRIEISAEKVSPQEKKKQLLLDEKVYYKITVADNGIGFEQEYAFRIFQIFQRLHGKAEYPGSGIGLAICKKIVDNHNGIIYAEGASGKGAVFYIILPENQ